MNGYPEPFTKAKYEELIFDIGKQINAFDPHAVWEATVLNWERVSILHTKVNQESSAKLDKWKNEIYYYSTKLGEILNAKADFLNKFRPSWAIPLSKTSVPLSVESNSKLELPKDFTVKQLTKHFEPSLTPSQAALLLFYFKDKGILPPYSDSSISKLAEAFFARNQKNVSTNLTNIHSLKASKNELESLKKVLSSLIKEIDDDIKKAR
jgi:hypothetical protein